MRRTITIIGVAALLLTPVGPALAQADPEANSVAFWCGSEDGGTKFEPVDTPFIVPEPPEGKTWTLLVLKAGSGDGANETYSNPIVGQGYSHSSGKDNSHTILCWEASQVTTTTTTTPTTSSTTSTSTTSPTTTTTTTSPTTTTAPPTTTTDPTTTTSSSTTIPTTTSTPTTSPTTTVPATPTTVPPTTTTIPELPNTGASDWIPVATIAAFLAIVLGGVAVAASIRADD